MDLLSNTRKTLLASSPDRHLPLSPVLLLMNMRQEEGLCDYGVECKKHRESEWHLNEARMSPE